MAQSAQYQIIFGSAPEIQTKLFALSAQSWRPVLMTATAVSNGAVMIFVILEHTT
jgi:hypothetical protein